MGSSSQIIIDLLGVLKSLEADIICFIEKPPAALAGISRRKNESKESGEVACCGRFSCCTHKLPGRTRSLRGGENGRISDSRTCDPEGSGKRAGGF